MTIKEFIAKFPECDVVNKNVLEDLACPECGQRESLKIQVNTMMTFLDNGTDEHGDTEWDYDSFCQCADCLRDGNVSDFHIAGLDNAVKERNKTKCPEQ